jgi:hypothetical protein
MPLFTLLFSLNSEVMSRFSQFRYSPGPGNTAGEPGGLLGRVVAFVVGIIVLGIAVFVGAIFIAAIVGLALIGGALFMARMWWLRRKMERYAREHGDLDAEYTVVSEETHTLEQRDERQ